ncbi:MAG TPA: ABC transporter permease, partial [Sphingomicrobium sp.]
MIGRHALLVLRLNLRNRLAMVYGFVFPLVFLGAFLALYRHDPIELHLAELLTVTILGGACFGFPTALVAERERGVWRRYRLTPAPLWKLMAATLIARLVLIAAAALIQFCVVLALGMRAPSDPIGLFIAFIFATLAFMAMGLVIASLADSVPAVQALGQCIFLPMLIIGGVAVRLSSLPDWAQHASAFFPGRYAVEALRASITGGGIGSARFALAALLAIGFAAAIAANRTFRWDAVRQRPRRADLIWVSFALAVWLAVGLAAERQADVVAREPETEQVPPPIAFVLPSAPASRRPVPIQSRPAQGSVAATSPEVVRASGWRSVSDEELAGVAFERLPPDTGIVAPIALFAEAPDSSVQETLDRVSSALPDWPPGRVADPEQRVRNLLCVAAVPDLLKMESLERFVPVIVYARIRAEIPKNDLPRLLYWIAL